jgi:hypothetical protein
VKKTLAVRGPDNALLGFMDVSDYQQQQGHVELRRSGHWGSVYLRIVPYALNLMARPGVGREYAIGQCLRAEPFSLGLLYDYAGFRPVSRAIQFRDGGFLTRKGIAA